MESLCGGVADVLVQSVSFSLSPHTPSPIACHLPQRIPLSAHRTVGDLPAHLIAWSSLVVVLCGFWFSQLLAIRLVPVDKLAERGSRSPSSESGAESARGRGRRELCCASRAVLLLFGVRAPCPGTCSLSRATVLRIDSVPGERGRAPSRPWVSPALISSRMIRELM